MHFLVNTALRNSNAVVFMHGASGSGKSYTLEGKGITKSVITPNSGIALRSIHSLFDTISQQAPGKFTISMSMYMLFNDKVFDLLNVETGKIDLLGNEH